MTSEKKSEYTLRISNASRAELIVILYDMAITYIQDAKDAERSGRTEDMKLEIARAISCIEEMQNNLHFEYELAKKLKQLYIYMKKQLRLAMISNEPSGLTDVESRLKVLREAYDKIAGTDTSGPVMVHTQAVLTGMTYSKTKALESLTTECASRGYRV